MADNKDMDNKEQQKEGQMMPLSPSLATKMRTTRLKADDPIDLKLKEVKEQKPHFDDMTSYMCTLLTPVDATTMTKKKSVPVQQTSPGKPASPGKASTPGRASSPAKPTSPAKHAALVKVSSPAEHAAAAKDSSPAEHAAGAQHSSPTEHSAAASPVKPTLPAKFTPPAVFTPPAKPTPLAQPTLSTPAARNSLLPVHSSLIGNQGVSLLPPMSGYTASMQSNRLRRLEIEIPESPVFYPYDIQMPGSPILNPSEHNNQVEFVQATITPPTPPPAGNIVEIGSEHEVVNTWECPQFNPTEVTVLANGLTMFIRNPDGSYDLYTNLQPTGPDVENGNVREVTFRDGPLVILTRDDEGKLTYDPDDTVVIDIADSSLFVLNTEEP